MESNPLGRRRETLDRSNVFDTAADQLPGFSVVMICKWKVLNVVVQAVAQIVSDMSGGPFGQEALPVSEDRICQADPQQQESGCDQHLYILLAQTDIDYTLNDRRNQQADTSNNDSRLSGSG